ncbi:MAG: enoyl-CoA hydratase-related protein [Beijerinckiaceae bacterium]
MTDEQTLRIETPADGVRMLTMDRPSKRNAIDRDMYGRLTQALRDADDDTAVRAVIITGAGGHFTAGNDLMDFMQDPAAAGQAAMNFLYAICDFSKPALAAVEGNAVGIGVTLLQHCDFAYVADGAKLAAPFVNLGLCPEGASSFILPHIAGSKRAADILMTGRSFDAAFAVEAGLANETVATGAALTRAIAQAEKVARLPAEAMRITKQLMRRADKEAVRAALDIEAKEFFVRLQSTEARQAFMAFFAKKA